LSSGSDFFLPIGAARLGDGDAFTLSLPDQGAFELGERPPCNGLVPICAEKSHRWHVEEFMTYKYKYDSF
jgi:hypothetical protein